MVDTLLLEVRAAEDESRQSPGRIVGTLLTYGERARDRPEQFLDGALRWPELGFNINEQHNRQAPIVRAVPYLDGKAIKIDAKVPDTQRGRDAITNIREGVYTGLSIEFGAELEEYRGALRIIKRGILGAAALVDRSSYGGSVVEVRERLAIPSNRSAYLWL